MECGPALLKKNESYWSIMQSECVWYKATFADSKTTVLKTVKHRLSEARTIECITDPNHT